MKGIIIICDTNKVRPNNFQAAAMSVAIKGGCPGSKSIGKLPQANIPFS